ncbi:unnamed protein product [Periconia digitata]|uniref:DUF2231 domain-containing protein n=1 Tax=Periconia digitata TaxID=1303443 RepID=A0A9W4U6J9_9PLEO|nr:unnamed protein product [Periconia digitata]
MNHTYSQSPVKTLGVQLSPAALPALAYYSNILSIVTAVPAIASGIVQLAPVIQRDGFSSKKAQTGVMHALISDLTVFAAVYNWWSRRDTAGFLPSTTNAVVSAAVVPTVFFAAFLGGQLTYQFGMGIGGGSSSTKKKQ